MLQQLVAALAVAAAALYTAWALTPARARFTALSRLEAALGPGPLRERLVRPLLKRALPAGGCASCGSAPAAAHVPPRRAREP
ncbi:MAG: hypothetical protein MUF07_13770 [Steroidobacteraceae bacterium]|jgi:hypothetical protein|nr:hypothetical protein [Steroidobacteraceae bacterium]